MRPDDLVAAVGRFLRRLHSSGPPSDTAVAGPAAYVDRARRRVESGAVDPASFDPPYRSSSPAALLDVAIQLASRLAEADPVRPVHGALKLGDLRIDGGDVVGWAVPEAPIVGDPYVDVAFLAADLATEVGPGAVPAVFDAAGIDRPEPARVEFWVTIRQLL